MNFSFGRWTELENLIGEDECDITNQIRHYIYRHWELSTHFREQIEATFSELDSFAPRPLSQKEVKTSNLLFDTKVEISEQDAHIAKIDKLCYAQRAINN